MNSILISAFHRLGIYKYLRDSWRSDAAEPRKHLSVLQRTVDGLKTSVDDVQASVPGLVEELRALERETRQLRSVIAIDQAQRGRWDALEATLDPSRIEASIARSFAGAQFDDDPMPHAVLRDLWPADTYAALLEAIPSDEFFPDKDKQNLKIRQMDTAPVWTRRALEFLEVVAIPRILTPALLARMRPYMEKVYATEYGPSVGPLVAALEHGPSAGRLMLRRPGYKLEPHLDPHRVAFTCLLYFARPGDDTAYGTQLFAVDRPIVVDRTNTFYPREHGYTCTEVKAVAFEPNTALVFLNRGGAHAAEIPRKAPRDTRRFSYQFYVAPDPALVESLVSDRKSHVANHK
ncbi:MAG: hypothetical protein FJW14_09110 [Acidimicrobiia bacterium]|nr:hypothetical protein [Acidimicrobiia bacterium]